MTREHNLHTMCIHQLFEQQAALTPDATALIYGDQQVTYQELNQYANQLARSMRKRGVGPETLVGICMPRSPELIVGLLAILKAGGAYLPLDPTYPIERLTWMLDDSRAPLLLTSSGIYDLPLAVDSERIDLESIVRQASVSDRSPKWDNIADESADNLENTTTPDNLAYVLYTSGSTGRPKGVMAEHRGAVNRFAWMWQTYPFAPGEVACHKTSLSFVDSVWEIFGPLLRGIPTVLIPSQQAGDPVQLVEALAAQRVTRIVLVPTLLQAILDSVPNLDQRLPALTYWTSSGEALSSELACRFHRLLPGRVPLNLYGSTEVAGDATWYEVREVDSAMPVPIGFPISGMHTYVLDDHLKHVATGEIGELYVGGVGLARGYLNRPDLTAERFISNPDKEASVTRLYKTGDLVRFMPDGPLEYIGRRDQQVKIRGFRVEPGEIEARLQRHASMQAAVVVAREDVHGNMRLVAYIVPRSGATGAVAEHNDIVGQLLRTLRDHLAMSLPEYMIPSAFVLLTELPRLPNGKIDRQSLPMPEHVQHGHGNDAAPRTLTEQTIGGVWAEALGLAQVSIHDDFLALGGHSLLAAQIIARLRDAFQVDIPLPTMLTGMTVAGMAAIIDSIQLHDQRGYDPVLLQSQDWEEGEL